MRRALAFVAASSAFFFLVPTIVLFPSMAQAATFSWSASSGDWSYGVNWSGGVAPASAAANTLAFSGATAWSSSDDIAGSFSLNSLNLAGAGAGTIADASTGSSTGLNFVSNGATTPTIAMNATGNISLSSSMAITNNLTIADAAGAGVLTLGTSANGTGNSNWLTGAGSLTINNNSSNAVILMGSNSFSGGVFVGPVTATTPGIQLGSANALAQSVLTLGRTSTTFPFDLNFSPGIVTFNVDEVMGNGLANLADTSGAGVNLVTGANNASWTSNVFFHGAGTLTKVGNGNMTLTNGNDNFTGDMAMNGGSISLASYSPAPGGGCPFSWNGGTLVWTDAAFTINYHDHPFNFIGNGTIDITTGTVSMVVDTALDSGTGTLTLNGPGEFGLTSSATIAGGTGWAGGVVVAKGTLMESTPRLGSNTGLSVQSGGQWEIYGGTANSENYSFANGAIVTLSGTGTNATYSGALLYAPSATAYNAVVNNSITLASTSSIVVGDNSTTAGTLTLTGSISGPGGLIKDYLGSLPAGRDSESTYFANSQGILALSGSNGYAGTTTINAGTILLQSNRALPTTTAVTISSSNGSTLDLGGNNATITGLLSSGVISSGGTVTNSGAANSTLTFAMINSNTTNFGGVIRNGATNNIAVVLNGNGEQILSGPNTYTGNTTISSGILGLGSTGSINSSPLISMANGTTLDVSAQPAYTLASGQTLTGTGSFNINGTMAVGAGATVLTTSSNLIRTLNVGGLTLNTGSLVNMDLTPSGTGDVINVTNNLTINGGSIGLFQVNGIVPIVDRGTYTLMNYGGSLLGAGTFSTVANPVPGLNSYTFAANAGVLTVTISGGNYWTGADVINGNSNWSDGNNWSALVSPGNGQGLAFSGVTGLSNTNDIVNLNAASVSFDSTTGPYVLSGNSIQLSGPISNGSTSTQTFGMNIGLLGTQAIKTATGNIVFNGVISDGGAGYGITVNAGSATVSLTAANTYSGVTSVTSGTLDLLHSMAVQNSTVAPVGTAAIAFDQSVGGAFTFGGLGGTAPVALTDNGGNPVTLTVGNNNQSAAYSGVLSGSGSLIKVGTGTQTLSGASTFNGGVSFNGGATSVNSLSIGGTSTSALGEGPPNASGQSLTFNGGELTYTGANTGGANSASNANMNNYNITLLASGGTLNNPNGYITLAGSFSGAGNFAFINTAYTGGLYHEQVFLSTATSNASQNFTGNIIIDDGGAVQLRSAATNLFGNAASVVIGPFGSLSADAGTTSPSLLPNPLVLNGGTLATQGVNMTYSGPVTANSGTINYVGWANNGSGSVTLSGSLQGSGVMSTIGTTSVVLSGSNNSGFTGAWESTGLATTFANTGAGSPNATWVANGQGFIANIAGGGAVSMGALTGTTGTVSNDLANTTSTFSVGALGTNSTFGGLIANGGASAITALTKVGSGSLALTGTYNYSGLTTVSGGTLQLGSTAAAPAVASVAGNIALANNSTLVFANAGTQAYVNQISGNGSVVFAGPGSLSLAASQAYTGRTVVQGGTLAVVAVGPTAMQLGFNGTAADSSGNNNNATLVNSPAYATGFLPGSQAISFNGSNQYAVVPYSSSLNLTGAYTVSLWEKGTLVSATSASTGGPALFSTRNGGNDDLDLQVNSAGLHGDIGTGTAYLTTSANSTISLGSGWNMITEVVNTTGYAIYVNGSLAPGGTGSFSGTPAFMPSSSENFSVGSQEAGTGPFGSDFNGAISQVEVFSSALSAAQVASLYNNPTFSSILPAVSPVSLAAGATLNLGSTQTVGSLTGAGTVTNSVATAPTLTVGTDNSSQTFSGLLQNGAGTLSVVKTGSGMWTLAGNNTYSGNTTVNGGTLQLGTNQPGNSGATGSLGSGGLTMGNAWLSFNRSDSAVVFPYPITSGTVSQDGSGMTTLALNNSYSGGTFINNGTLQVGNSGSTGSLGSGPVVNNGSLVLTRSDALFNISAALSGSGSIYQNGSGTTTLSGPAGGFTGPITVNNGNLYLNGANSTSYINVASGAVLGGKGTASAGTAELQNNANIEAGQGGTGSLTLAGLLLDNNANININNLLQYSSTNLNSAVPAITVTGSNALLAQTISNYGIQVNLGGAPFYNTIPQDARLLAYTGSSNLGLLANLTVANNLSVNIPGLSSRAVFNFLPLSADPGYIDLQFSVSYPVWTGAGNGVWDNNVNQSPQNWKLASSGTGNNTPTNFLVGDAAVFDDSAGSGHTVVSLNGTGNVDPASVTFNNNILSYTLSGANAIEGAAVVTLNGSGSVTILNTNTYYGGTTVNAGILNIGNQFALGSAANYVLNGATFTINGGSIDNVTGGPLTTDNYPISWNGGFTFVGSNPLNLGAGGVTLASSAAAVNISGSTLEIDGVIGDGGQGFGFTQSGAGVLLLTGSSTYLGPTVVNGGTLQIGNGGSGASIGSTSNVVLAANTLLLFDHNDSQTFPASTSGSGSMTQMGGLLNLTNSNTYTGGTTVASGSLELSFGGPAGTLAPGATVIVDGGAFLVLNASNALGTSGSYTSLTVNSGGLAFANSGYRVPLYNATMTGGTLASAVGNGDGNGNFSLGGTLSATSDAFGNPVVIAATQVSLISNSVLNVTHGNAASPADLVVSSTISSFPSGNGLTLQGNGFTQFTGANTYNGGTTVLGGTLQLASGTATLGASSGGLTVASGALLDTNGVNTLVGGLNGSGTIDNVGGTFGSSPSLTVGNGNTSGTFSGTIQNTSGATSVVKVGTGTQVLSGTNSYAGGTTINAGVLNFAPSALGSGPVTFGGGTLQWATGNTLDVSTSPGIAPIASGKVADLNTNGNNVTFNSGLSGAGGLTKIGAGMLTLAAADTFSGASSITGGTLELANPLALQNSTANVSISNSLVLSGAATSAVTLGGLSGSGAFNLGVAALTVGGNNATTTYSGVLGGGSAMTKTGTGTLTLNTPSISGPIDITGGVLAVQNNTVAIKVGSTGVSGSDGPTGAVASKWNNLLGASPIGSNLVDNFGLATTTSMNTSLSGTATPITGITDPLLANYIFLANGTITVNLAGIPYSSYSIYAFSADKTAGHNNTLTLGGNTYYFTAEAINTFSQINNTNPAYPLPSGNYAVVTGLTGASQTLTISSTQDTGFCGFEIVNTTNSMATSPVTISNGGTFNMTGGMQTIASLSSTDGNGSKVVLGNGFLTVGNSGASTFDGVISGSGGQVVLQGAGSMLFTGSNTYTGPTTVSGGGTLQLGDGAVNNGSVVGNIALANNSAVVFANPSTQLYTGVISGTGSFIKNAAGTLQLVGNHTYSGPTVINAGTVQLGYGANPQVTVSGFGANTAGQTGVLQGNGLTNGTWTFNSYSYSYGYINTPVTGGSLDLTDGNTTGGGLGSGEARSAWYNTPVPVNSSFQATFTYTPANVENNMNYDNGFAFVVAKSGGTSLVGAGRGFGVARDPDDYPELDSGGTATLPIGNSLNINYDVFQNNGNVYGSTTGAATGYNTNGGTLTNINIFSGNSYVPGDPINMAVSYNALTDVLTWSGTDAAKSLTFSESQAGVNLQSITGGTSAFLGFTGANGYLNSTQTITNFAYTTVNTNGTLPSTTPLFVASGGTLDLFGGSQTVGDLSGSGVVTNSFSPSIATLTVGGDNTSQTFSGTLQDGGGTLALTVVGGMLTLTGTNNYSGGTTVDGGGTLVATNNEAIEDGTNLYVGNDLGAFFSTAVPAGASAANSLVATAAVPEPGTVSLLVVAISGAAVYRRLRRRSKTAVIKGV
jgi:fibronectin-binding autotransporter adhesin